MSDRALFRAVRAEWVATRRYNPSMCIRDSSAVAHLSAFEGTMLLELLSG